MSPEIGRILLVVGLAIAGVGLLAVLGVRIPFGNLPGDIRIENERGVILIPLATMLLLSDRAVRDLHDRRARALRRPAFGGLDRVESWTTVSASGCVASRWHSRTTSASTGSSSPAFYEPPRDGTMRRWRAQAPIDFEFTIKAWQLITHDALSPTYRRLRSPLTEVDRGSSEAWAGGNPRGGARQLSLIAR